MIGKMLGPYELLAPIGAGGMGEVWKARDTRLGLIFSLFAPLRSHPRYRALLRRMNLSPGKEE